MTRRPDIFDRSTPSPGWRARAWRPLLWRDLLLIIEALQGVVTPKLDLILKEIKKMSVSVDKLNADIQTLVSGYQAVVTERDALKAALASADATKAQAVADAIAAEDADAQAKIDAADAVVDGVNNPAPPAPAEGGNPPADGSV